ncbi:hypothetical protein [Methanococcoides methylutens]|uniref:Uncharacterized protein n=1 Tax=Methanococcoides methylutens MM1 TaxID=1434104 RepID=A0A0E3X0I9_METMT|nr:hypothetical protein [Methanococcoides methylutens]AKB85354.1 hypothetical protein MCMEM_1301 [Methanococcoides methylutens MM1]
MSYELEEKCYICGRTKNEIMELSPHNMFLKTVENKMEHYSTRLTDFNTRFINELESYIGNNKESPFLDFTVESVENDYNTFSQKIPYLEEILTFKASKSQNLSEIMETLVYLKNVLEKIQKDPTNAGQYLGKSSFNKKSEPKIEYYFRNLMPPEPSRYERRFPIRGSIKDSDELKIISELTYNVELCKSTIDNLKESVQFGVDNGNIDLFTSCPLDISELFPGYDNDIIEDYKYNNRTDDYSTDGLTIDLPVCLICSSMLKKYIKKYETYY